jgi:signal transduction histidine kinase
MWVSSLQNRMFVATALVAVVSLASIIPFIASRITREGEAELRRGLLEAADHAERHHATRLETLTLVTRLIADLPVLKALVDTADKTTVEGGAREYLAQAHANVIAVTDRQGNALALLGTRALPRGRVREALAGRTVVAARVDDGRLIEEVTVPIRVQGDVLGTLALGLNVDQEYAAHIETATSSEVAVVLDGRVLASTAKLPEDQVVAASEREGVTIIHTHDLEYAAVARPLTVAAAEGPRPVVVLLRSFTERLLFLRAMRTGLVGAAVVAVTLAVVLSYAVARTVARPLASITDTMRSISASGDLTRKIPTGGPWDDEDARLLATTFSALTDSIRRFQQESALKERLSALGRLSTVIAHEVRNPLMIIRGSLRILQLHELGEGERLEAVADIDQEVTRLDRIVRDVLEFTRPVDVERTATDMGAVCRAAAQALAHEKDTVAMRIEPGLPMLSTDGERLRRALLNLLTNARDAVAGRPVDGQPLIELRASRRDENGGIVLEVEDRGAGIAADDLPHVFEPYFSTKRTGTGLGLAITRNIVESLGGTISARSHPGEGTVMRIELPS